MDDTGVPVFLLFGLNRRTVPSVSSIARVASVSFQFELNFHIVRVVREVVVIEKRATCARKLRKKGENGWLDRKIPKHFRKTGFAWASYVPRSGIHKLDRATATNVFLHWMARGRHKNS